MGRFKSNRQRKKVMALLSRKDFASTKRGTVVTAPFNKRLKGEHFPIETTVYVPSTKYRTPITEKKLAQRVKETRKVLSDFFGGYTSVEATGGWAESKKVKGKKTINVIEEPVVKVTSFARAKAFEKNNTKFRNWLNNKKKNWKQKALSFEMEGDLFLIE